MWADSAWPCESCFIWYIRISSIFNEYRALTMRWNAMFLCERHYHRHCHSCLIFCLSGWLRGCPKCTNEVLQTWKISSVCWANKVNECPRQNWSQAVLPDSYGRTVPDYRLFHNHGIDLQHCWQVTSSRHHFAEFKKSSCKVRLRIRSAEGLGKRHCNSCDEKNHAHSIILLSEIRGDDAFCAWLKIKSKTSSMCELKQLCTW